MVAVKSIAPAPPGAPMGPPMGGQMGPPPAAPAVMPNMGVAPPGVSPQMPNTPPPGTPQQASTYSGMGGSASGRAKFKGSLSARRNAYLAKMNTPPPVVGVQPSFGQFAGGPMGPAMGPVPPMVGPPNTMMAGGGQLGRMIGDNANVGSAPVQMMNGGVIPLFGGLGRY